MSEEGKRFGAGNVPIERLLGEMTRSVFQNQVSCGATILQRSFKYQLQRFGCRPRLTAARPLNAIQIAEFRRIVLDSTSYWIGKPVYRRLPPNPGFCVEVVGSQRNLEVLIDLQNPGWEFYCGEERYWGFNFAGSELRSLAKELFPEYASKSSSAVWRNGALAKLSPILP